MALNDVYELVLRGTLFGQAVVNTFFYAQTDEPSDEEVNPAQNMASAFVDAVLDSIVATITNDVSLDTLTVRNLFDAADGFVELLGVVGNVVSNVTGLTNDTLSAFVAYGFKLVPGTSATGKGSKRFAGVDEAVQSDGVVTHTEMIGQLTTLATALGAPVTGTLDLAVSYVPVIVKRVRSGASGNYVYRLPASAGEATFAKVVDVLPTVLLTSQVSRKIGVGE